MLEVPITYMPGYIAQPLASTLMAVMQQELDWIRHDKTPRSEYYCSDLGKPYTYGTPPFARTYRPQNWHPAIEILRDAAEQAAGCKFDVVFLNRYLDQTDQLGWHADDSPEMDDARPIAIISLGVQREIMFREKPEPSALSRAGVPPVAGKLLLEHGSLCLMHAGMQDTHQHRIPRAGFQCGERISLTFRGYAEQK